MNNVPADEGVAIRIVCPDHSNDEWHGAFGSNLD
jgi:hypothetical protein